MRWTITFGINYICFSSFHFCLEKGLRFTFHQHSFHPRNMLVTCSMHGAIEFTSVKVHEFVLPQKCQRIFKYNIVYQYHLSSSSSGNSYAQSIYCNYHMITSLQLFQDTYRLQSQQKLSKLRK